MQQIFLLPKQQRQSIEGIIFSINELINQLINKSTIMYDTS